MDGMTAAGARPPSLLRLLSLQDFRRFVPETLGLLLLIVLARGLLETVRQDASGAPPVFWIPVLLMAAQYGIMGGLFAAGSTSLLVLTTELPRQSTAQDFYDYAAFAAAQPCAWFTAALVLGGLRTLHVHHQARLEERLEETRTAAEGLADRLIGAAGEMTLLEERIAADTATAAVLLDAFARLDLSSRQALLGSFAEIFRHGAGARSFVVFLREGGALVPRFGLEDGSPMQGATLALLPRMSPERPCPDEADDEARGAGTGLPILVPIRTSATAEPIGCLVCSGITPAQTPAMAARRLDEVCRVLAKLLVLPLGSDPGTASPPGRA